MGKKNWSIVDGYRPPRHKGECDNYVGHECVMILNRTKQDAHCLIDIYFEDKDPVLGIPFTAKAERISSFYTDNAEMFGGLGIDPMVQYSMYIRSDTEIVVQYGRMDVNQDNLAYMVTLGYGE